MPYVKQHPTQKLALPSDSAYWAVVKQGFTYGELKQFYEYGGSEKSFTPSEKLKLCIVEWNLDDAEGNVLPIDEASIDLLEENDVLAIADAATRVESDELKKNSPKQ